MTAIASPHVSVVIPVFNGAGTIRRAIGSVTDQSVTDLEIVVVDDASTDATADHVAGIDDGRVRLVRHDENQGAASARNTGISSARGTYVGFLDADDEWLPGKLEAQLAFLGTLDDGVGVATTGFHLHRVDRDTTVTRIPTAERGWLPEFLDVCAVAPGTTMIAHRSVFEDIGVYAPLPRYEDWDWLLRLIGRFPFDCLPEPLAIVHREGWPAPATVDAALDALLSMQAEHVATIAGRAGLRRFQASIEIERAIAGFHARQWSAVASHLARAGITSPGRTASFLRRAYDRQRGRV